MTHVDVDGRLWCGVKSTDHHWDSWCRHNRDPNAHPYFCCRHRPSEEPRSEDEDE